MPQLPFPKFYDKIPLRLIINNTNSKRDFPIIWASPHICSFARKKLNTFNFFPHSFRIWMNSK